jgi:hypothetical protein
MSNIVNLSVPTKEQVLHGAERALGVFVVAALAYLRVNHQTLSTASLHGLWLAGLTAVYQLVLSTVTSL